MTIPIQAVIVHRFAIMKCSLYVLGTILGATLAALSGMDWAESDGQTKVMVVLGIGATVCTSLGAFFDQSIRKVEEGRDPLTGLPVPVPATQEQVDRGKNTTAFVTPETLKNTP